MPRLTIRRGAYAGVTLLLAGSALMAQQQVQVVVTAVPNPVPAGGCAGIWVEVRDASNQRLANVDGIQLYSTSYDYSVPNVAEVAWKNGDPTTGYLCTNPGAGAVNIPVTATIRGTTHAGSTYLGILPGAATQVASAGGAAGPAGATAAGPAGAGYSQGAAGGAAGAAGATAAGPAGAGYSQGAAGGAAGAAGATAAGPAGAGYSQGAAGGATGAAGATAAGPAGAGYSQGAAGGAAGAAGTTAAGPAGAGYSQGAAGGAAGAAGATAAGPAGAGYSQGAAGGATTPSQPYLGPAQGSNAQPGAAPQPGAGGAAGAAQTDAQPGAGGAPSAAQTYAQPSAGGAPPQSGPPGPTYAQATAQAQPSGAGAGQGAAPQPQPGYQPGAPGQNAPSAGYQQGGPPNAQMTPVSAPAVAAPAQPAKKGGGFFKKLGQHLKDKVGEVANQTTENLASTANQVVDATAQTGSNLVSGATAQASSTARSAVGGLANGILPIKGSSDNLSTTLNSGTAEFRNKLFTGNTSVLEPAGNELLVRLAQEFKSRPDKYQIQFHVDPIPNALQISMDRAAVFKEHLNQLGVDGTHFEAVGWGAVQYRPEVPPDGGPPSGERMVIVRKGQ
jgi:hypothetical protein